MSSAQTMLELAHDVIDHDPGKAAPLVRLLYVFKHSHADPRREAETSTVLKALWSETDESERMGLVEFVGDEQGDSLAA